MYKRILLVLFLLPISLNAGTVIDSLGEFKEYVRQFSGIESTELLPDTTLRDFSALAIVNTSVEVGGVQAQFNIVTVAEQSFYILPDSVVTVLYTSLISSEGGTFVIRAGYPQYLDGVRPDGRIGVADDAINLDDNQVPDQYHYWADSLQFLPAPIRNDDTLVIKCFVEHQTLSVNGDSLRFTYPDFATAAVFLATAYSLMSVDEFDKATQFFNLYTAKKQELIARYQSRLDIPPTVSQ